MSPTAANVGGLFFPQRTELGLDSREATPELTRSLCHLAAHVRSFERAETVVKAVFHADVSDSTIRRVTEQVGLELANQSHCAQRGDGKEATAPHMAVVSCDGGRLRTRKEGQGRGVTLANETGWRETKNASFEKSELPDHHVAGEDSCEELPDTFRSVKDVASIAEKPVPKAVEASSGASPPTAERVVYKGPKRVLRTAVSSMSCSDDFGPMMKNEAHKRRFFEAQLRAFLGDGLHWNWSIWKAFFSSFIPILDFIHAIQYLFAAAMALLADEPTRWATYVRWATSCWQGRVAAVIEEMRAACVEQNIDPDAKLDEKHPLKPLHDAVRYLTNNQSRMDYPRYRRLGLPVTSAPMESLIKQMNLRVKGTEMFWNEPTGAEAILHLRAAALSDDGRLDTYLTQRPGCPYVRRTTQATAA